MINKVRCFLLIFVLVSTFFADDLFTESKWQFYNEYVQKDNVFFNNSNGNSNYQQSKFPIYAKEFGYALGASVGILGTGIGAGLLLEYIFGPKGLYFGEGGTGKFFFSFAGVSIILQPAFAAWGTCKAANEIEPAGSYMTSCLSAAGGSILGLGIGIGTGLLIDRVFHNVPVSYISGSIVYVLCNSIGAVIGYNLSVPKNSVQGFHRQHFDLPSFTMKTEKTKEGKTITALEFRLINARF